jgi:hypothetical protein
MPTARPKSWSERFHADRNQVYREFGVRCRDLLAEIAKEITAGNLTFAALEENEHDVHKLHTWLGKIRGRDVFGAPQANTAADALAACEQVLRGFAEAIYDREGLQVSAEDDTRAAQVTTRSVLMRDAPRSQKPAAPERPPLP